MSIIAAEMIWVGVGAYLAVGLMFALVFVVGGAGRIDRATKGAGALFRVLILPGAALLWPLLLFMWISGAGANRSDAA
ncbi:MAG: hypothetical protein U5J99_01330 [Parvularculaceae bacterium]|nr:hypothetical protein [Parvularculaceae bacterium]